MRLRLLMGRPLREHPLGARGYCFPLTALVAPSPVRVSSSLCPWGNGPREGIGLLSLHSPIWLREAASWGESAPGGEHWASSGLLCRGRSRAGMLEPQPRPLLLGAAWQEANSPWRCDARWARARELEGMHPLRWAPVGSGRPRGEANMKPLEEGPPSQVLQNLQVHPRGVRDNQAWGE